MPNLNGGTVKIAHSRPAPTTDISLRVGEFLMREGYLLAGFEGIAHAKPFCSDHVGIVLNDLPPLRRSLRDLLQKRRRRTFLGVLWFPRRIRGSHDDFWQLQVYGNAHEAQARAIAQKLKDKFRTEILVSVITPESRQELFLDEFDPENYYT